MPAHLMHGYGNSNNYYYPLWRRIRQCCYDQNYQAYHNYGGRGIRVYTEWDRSFTSFLEGVISEIGERPSRDHSLDRIENDGNYEPGNIRWSTRKEQGRNRRGNHTVTALGETRTVAEWVEISGVRFYTICRRLYSGWSELRAVFEPERMLPRKERVSMKHVEVIIDEEGQAKIEVFGATGAECEDLTADIEKALGKTTDRKRKHEYYHREQNRDQELRG